eukprot:TRINITY_DN6141_c0_g1_i3.p1 TRINITY_DN6141_c0_g1~~TRINITY_DN6141_c0_g1_i3.p1  ORF type:complete len:121 (-),score=22.95 TRINITY_DN6141_c0_g1_i3:719-1081(-)
MTVWLGKKAVAHVKACRKEHKEKHLEEAKANTQGSLMMYIDEAVAQVVSLGEAFINNNASRLDVGGVTLQCNLEMSVEAWEAKKARRVLRELAQAKKDKQLLDWETTCPDGLWPRSEGHQ